MQPVPQQAQPGRVSAPSAPHSQLPIEQDGQPVRGSARLLRLHSSERVRFVAAGAFNTGFGYLTFAAIILLLPDLHYTFALLLAHVVGVLVAYVVYRRAVFGVTGGFLRDLPKFWSVYLAGLAMSLLLLPVFVGVLGIPVLLAPWLVVCVTAVFSYLGTKHYAFRRGPRHAQPRPPVHRA